MFSIDCSKCTVHDCISVPLEEKKKFFMYLHVHPVLCLIKDKGEFWSCDCIVKEKVWNGSETVDHVVCKYWCALQGSGVIKIIINLAESW